MHRIFLYLAILLISNKVNAQKTVIKSSDHINPWMNLSEWIFKNANLTYDSYDLNTFEVFWNGYSSNIYTAPLIFIDAVKYNALSIESNILVFPNISPTNIDSVIIDSDSKIINGYLAENGSIQIFLKKDDNAIFLEKGVANEINDPGPHISSELRSQNVEVIDNVEKMTLWFPKKWNTSLILSRNIYSRTNFFVYDDKVNTRLFSRTLDKDELGEPRLQRNIILDAVLTNNFRTDALEFQFINSLTRKGNYYQWSPLAGIELPFSMSRYQSGISIKPKSTGFFKGFNAHISYSNYDSLYDAGLKAFEMEEFSFDQSASFQFSEKISFNAEANIYNWNDQITSKSNNTTSWKSSIVIKDNLEYLFLVGNYEQGISINSTKNKSLISFNTFRTDLKRTGYNYLFAKEGVGFSMLNNLENRILSNSDLVNFYSGISYRKKIQTQTITFSGKIELKHYWKLSNYKTEYEYIPSNPILNTSINYYETKNIGILNYNITADASISPDFSSRTMLTSNINTYGSSAFNEGYQRVTAWNFSQSIKYSLDKNAFLEIGFSYIPARKINEFSMLDENLGWPTIRVRPIKLLSGTAKAWFFNKSLLMTLALRNLLNSTESYNTNGQYYNMSISVSASLALGNK
ncbi:MAG: hypothetical protein CL671_12970 [Balneola sp.]|jgi:hypothetical protein|nr:hypothetical protein [Balneola sp.]MBF65523.1 hypothetical protein [Balneola sp.]|tara:strand:- start:5193 stop:7091 length:1899 start_codon:yes stop_codon:yes gene_type:complete